MRQTLNLHPDFRCPAVTHIDVDVTRPRPGMLALCYVLRGDISRLHLPPERAPERTDGLWQHTCFEAFIRGPQGDSYCEFNLSPSTQWAAYGFSGYREGMVPLDGIDAPRIEMGPTAEGCAVQTALALEGVPGLPADADWHIGLSAVIEEDDGSKSYWALAHPPGKPDFHARECFALTLPPA